MKDILNDYSIGQDDAIISFNFVFERLSDLSSYKIYDEIESNKIKGNEICAVRRLLHEIEKFQKFEVVVDSQNTKDRYFISYEKLMQLISTVSDLYHCCNLNDYLFPYEA